MNSVMNYLLSAPWIGSTSAGKAFQYKLCEAYEYSKKNIAAQATCQCRIYGQNCFTAGLLSWL